MRVLVVEDDDGIAQGLVLALRQQGWAVDVVDSVAPALAALRSEPFQMVLLDLGLRDGDGSEVLQQVRQAPPGKLPDPATPIMIMTARDQVASRIAGLDMGADDYILKPFDSGELAARIRALRRRSSGRADPLLRWADVLVDPAARTVTKGSVRVDLSPREFALLLALLEASPRVLSREQLEASLYDWGGALESNAIEVHIHRLRKKLGNGMVVTMRGVGYFVPPESKS
jgi:DNA-binding response OmpR family regulator